MGGHWGLGSKRPEVSKMRKHRTALDSTVSIRPVVASQSFREGTPKMQAKPRDGDIITRLVTCLEALLWTPSQSQPSELRRRASVLLTDHGQVSVSLDCLGPRHKAVPPVLISPQ